MITYILIGGHIHKSKDAGKAFCEELVKSARDGQVKILDCIFARPQDEWEKRFNNDKNFFSEYLQHFEIELAVPEKFVDQIKHSDVVFFQGGIPRQLMSVLDTTVGWREVLDGKIVVGSSGGADALCTYYGVGKTGSVGEGLGLLPVKFIPHWKSESISDADIHWDGLFEKLKNYKDELEVVVLRDEEFKVITV